MALHKTKKDDFVGSTEDHDHDDTSSMEKTLDLRSQNLIELNGQLLTTQSHAITVLKLNFNSLSSLPHSFAQCVPNLKVLHANGNSLTQLPGDFGSLTSLTVLELNDNELTCLPDSVKHLINLKRLQLTGNQLSSLSDDFGEMIHLEELDVDENRLMKFPPTFALLDKLRILEASHNRLCILPKFLGNMRSLTHFCVSNNRLEALPNSFSELNQLVIVDVSCNILKILPDGFSSQSTLEKFFAGCNQFTTIPDWLGHLPEMTELCLKENVIGGDCFLEDFGKVCKKLRHLDMSGSNVTSLPESFGELESLEWAHFGSSLQGLERRNDYINGNWLFNIPASFSQLSNLSMLRLDENHLQSLPEDFGSLCSLDYLDLGHNLLHDLPESFGNLHKLRVCMLSYNSIQLLPSTIGHLTSLEELHLDFNLLEELPESFKELTQLELLDLSDNKLTELPTFLKSFDKLNALNLDRNPLKMLKRLVPSISRVKGYKPRSENPQRTWRGRKQIGNMDIEPLQAISIEGQSDDEMADEPVDEMYSPEDLPYNLRFERSPDISVLTTRHISAAPFSPCDEDANSHEEPSTTSNGEESSVSETHSDEESDSMQEWDDSCQDEASRDGSSSPVPNNIDSKVPAAVVSEEEDWYTCPPTVPANGTSEENSPPPATDSVDNEEPAVTPPEENNSHGFTPPPYIPNHAFDENWETDLYDCPQSACPPICLQRKSCIGPSDDFFQLPSQYHSTYVSRPLLNPEYKPPEPEEGQFCDDDIDAQTERSDPCESSPSASIQPAAACVLTPCDLHAPRVRRPRFDPDYVEPGTVLGQFNNTDWWC